MPKATGAHRDKRLNPKTVKTLVPGRHPDGGGLYLEVEPSLSRRWTLRIVVQGRRRDIGLGSPPTVVLAEARERAAKFRKIARDGGDPLAEKRLASAPSFERAARDCYESHSEAWKNAKHRAQWLTTLETYVFPKIGKVTVDRVEASDILSVLRPIWTAKPETARRVRQRIGLVMEWAKAEGYRRSGNPITEIGRALPRQTDRQEHHPALPYAELPAFYRELSAFEGNAARALEFAILTCTRTSETIGATWAEIDLQRKQWTIPAERMKGRREHRVPLSDAAVRVLILVKPERTVASAFVFPGRKPDKQLSNMAMLGLLQRQMGRTDITVHGFRSTFRDWSSEQTNTPNEVCEHALAHVTSNKTEAAYRRTDMFDKRRTLMDIWAVFCSTGRTVLEVS